MMRLLRALLFGIFALFGLFARAAFSVVTAPLKWLGTPEGRSAIPRAPSLSGMERTLLPAAPRPAPSSVDAAPADAPVHVTALTAAKLIAWCDKSLADPAAAPFSTGFPKNLRVWAEALGDDGKRRAIEAGFTALSAHLAGRVPIEGLPPLTGRVSASSDALRRKRINSSAGRSDFVVPGNALHDDEDDQRPAFARR